MNKNNNAITEFYKHPKRSNHTSFKTVLKNCSHVVSQQLHTDEAYSLSVATSSMGVLTTVTYIIAYIQHKGGFYFLFYIEFRRKFCPQLFTELFWKDFPHLSE